MSEEIDFASLNSLMRPRKVCLCRSVTEAQLVSAIENGCDTLEKLVTTTTASTNCGNCATKVLAIFNREIEKKNSEIHL